MLPVYTSPYTVVSDLKPPHRSRAAASVAACVLSGILWTFQYPGVFPNHVASQIFVSRVTETS